MEESVEERVFRAVAEKALEISEGIIHRRSYSGTKNQTDDLQLEADVWANEVLKEEITSIDGVGQFVSEEEEIVECGEGHGVTVDPLDGSSNIPTNNLVGTIVGVYDRELPCRGRHLVSAFYVLYGPITTIIRAQEGNVEEFVVKEEDGRIKLHRSHEDIRLPEEPAVYGFGGNLGWFQEFHDTERAVKEELKLRYGGSLVGDSNQILHQGGIFGYPPIQGSEEGKIRLLFEANPMAYVFECAGGRSSDGEISVLDKKPEHIHQRTPLFIGNREMVDSIEKSMER